MIDAELRRIPDAEKVEENQRTPRVLYEGKGCKECGNKGTKGRVAIVEVIPMNERLRAATAERKTHDDILKIVEEEGFLSMRQDGFLKALSGVAPIREVLEVTVED
jgi:type II secretory ATPase GspE/PulE/Tfp pilus assembly ATPase PilB-like protein